ncbi:MAG: VWA domain-containing protein [Ferruginibacter sp.]|nr:VWA domain-containing protein [Bacteroidota bacterium]MBX2919024.1 VWA domain-containing protein [Ferruginibacter sp.]MCB0710396.1 VWA domain-containing protein [Chitinophagaceae bacterium]MCC7379708.1 VWA domain-containing protein [Chitinophagaceae bacterium]
MLYSYFKNISFSQPWFFALLLIVPLLIYWYAVKNNKVQGAVTISDISAKGLGSWKTGLRHLLFVIRLMAIVFIIAAMARPQTMYEEQHVDGEGVDIVLCIDVSGSMTAQDLTPNRLEAAKKVAVDFVDKRQTDRIAVVIFSGESFTQCPLTTDYSVVKSAIENIRNGLLEDGTAIGSGLGTSVDRLRESKSKSKVVILLTDGENNGGLIDPETAKEIAKAFKVKVYTIGVGTDGYAPTPVNTPMGIVMQQSKVSIDEKLLKEIATETGGKYFRAKDNAGLTGIYDEINKLEKSKVEVTARTRFTEKFFPFVLAALGLILLELILKFTVFRKFP